MYIYRSALFFTLGHWFGRNRSTCPGFNQSQGAPAKRISFIAFSSWLRGTFCGFTPSVFVKLELETLSQKKMCVTSSRHEFVEKTRFWLIKYHGFFGETLGCRVLWPIQLMKKPGWGGRSRFNAKLRKFAPHKTATTTGLWRGETNRCALNCFTYRAPKIFLQLKETVKEAN